MRLNIVCLLLSLFTNTSIFSQRNDSLALKKAKIEANLKLIELEKKQLDSTLEIVELALLKAKLTSLGFPIGKQNGEVIHHAAMSLQYNEEHEQAAWVMHAISPKILEGAIGRSNDFRPDPKVKSGTAVEKDYFISFEKDGKIEYEGFGYDRGHLAPSADFRWSRKALSESYFYSNMSPQLPEFNRESWAELESLIRSYVLRTKNTLFVVTGPILENNLPKVNRSINGISIPNQYFKAILDPKTKTGLAFLLPHKKCKSPFSTYAISIDSLETLSGWNFFSLLSNEIEEIAEKNIDYYSLFPLKDGDAVPLPISKLGKNKFNTEMVNKFIGMEKTICGTVVSTYKSSKGNVFINLDKRFPRTDFSIDIWSSNIPNFSYMPEQELQNKKVCVKGKIESKEGVANVSVNHEREIWILDELN